MALPSSGSLSIKGTAGTDRSIACEVDGNVTGDKSLSTLSVSAGKSAPHSMLEFYGYSSVVWYSIGAGQTLGSSSNCCDIYFPLCIEGRTSGDIVTICMSAGQRMVPSVYSCYYISENGGSWVGKGCNAAAIASFGIDYNDSLCVRIMLCDPNSLGGINEACFCLEDPPAVWTTGSGTACRCAPYVCAATIVGF